MRETNRTGSGGPWSPGRPEWTGTLRRPWEKGLETRDQCTRTTNVRFVDDKGGRPDGVEVQKCTDRESTSSPSRVSSEGGSPEGPDAVIFMREWSGDRVSRCETVGLIEERSE